MIKLTALSSRNLSEDELLIILENKKIFKRVIYNSYVLSDIAKKFPVYADDLINHVLEDNDIFKSVIQNGNYLSFLAKEFPVYANALITRVLEDNDIFKSIIQNRVYLSYSAKKFPLYVDALINRVLEDKDIFEYIIKDKHDLFDITKEFPDHADQLIHCFLKDKKIFKKFIQDEYSLADCVRRFPKYDEIFKKSSIEEAAEAGISYVKSYNEIRKNSRLLNQALRTPDSVGYLPVELLIKIASQTGELDKKEAVNIAYMYFRRPKASFSIASSKGIEKLGLKEGMEIKEVPKQTKNSVERFKQSLLRGPSLFAEGASDKKHETDCLLNKLSSDLDYVAKLSGKKDEQYVEKKKNKKSSKTLDPA